MLLLEFAGYFQRAASIPAKSGVSTGMSGRDAAETTFLVALYLRDFHFFRYLAHNLVK
jgi:hypothetical protein